MEVTSAMRRIRDWFVSMGYALRETWIVLNDGDDHANFIKSIDKDPLIFIHALLTFVIFWWAMSLDFNREAAPWLLVIMTASHWHAVLTFGTVIGAAGLIIKRALRISVQVLSFLHGLIAIAIIVYKPWEPYAAPYAALALFSGYLCWKRRA